MNKKPMSKKTQLMVLTAFLMTLQITATMALNVPTTYGNINLGDLVLVAVTILMPTRIAMVIAGFGGALADILGGYSIYAGATFVIKIIGVLIIRSMVSKMEHRSLRLTVLVVSNLTMALLYSLTDVIIMNFDMSVFIISFPLNLIQAVITIIIGYFIYTPLLKLEKYL